MFAMCADCANINTTAATAARTHSTESPQCTPPGKPTPPTTANNQNPAARRESHRHPRHPPPTQKANTMHACQRQQPTEKPMHTKSTTRHQPRHQVGHARREYDAAPGQATADLADNPIARSVLLALVIALTITGGGAILWQAAQHPAVATLTAGIILTTLTWRWAR